MKIPGILLLLTLVIAGCGGGPRTAEETTPKIRVEAYLFDAELRRSGKPTSFRLEIFHTDSLMALSGRGYLGKGALRGRVTPDSLICLLPASDEYLKEPILKLMNALECPISPAGMNLMHLFNRLPDSSQIDPAIDVVANLQDDDHPSYIIYIENCPWQMELKYHSEDELGWRLEEFVFFDGKDTRLKATRREFKKSASVKPDRFEVRVPADAARIEP